MMGPRAALLAGGARLHLQHGPIDLIIGVDGDRDAAFKAAQRRFETLLEELVSELDSLKRPVSTKTDVEGTCARRMVEATRPLARIGMITPMAAVAGAVAEEVLSAMTQAARMDRAYVNNGGDIAIHLKPGQTYSSAMAAFDGTSLGRIDLTHNTSARGIATSGRHGRSLSLGIADSVTVLARTAAMADAAATVIANAVDLPGHPAVTRLPACDLVDDSDLGSLPVVTACGQLSRSDQLTALHAGRAQAVALRAEGLIEAAALFLQDEAVTIGTTDALTTRIPAHA